MATLKQISREGLRYPESDGKPMAESPAHGNVMTDSRHLLEDRYRVGAPAYVGSNNVVYLKEGDFKKRISPDVYVTKGISREDRGHYRIWEEGPPHFVLEVTSEKTPKGDLGKKRRTYREIGVREYVLFDPYGDWIPEQLRAFRLGVDGRYRRIMRNLRDRISSRELGLELGVRGEALRFFEAGAEQALPTRRERADSERARAERERARAEAERQEKEHERAEKEHERRRAEVAEQESRGLREELERMRRMIQGRAKEATDAGETPADPGS